MSDSGKRALLVESELFVFICILFVVLLGWVFLHYYSLSCKLSTVKRRKNKFSDTGTLSQCASRAPKLSHNSALTGTWL